MSATVDRTAGANLRVVLYEGKGSSPIEPAERHAVLAAMLTEGFEVTRTTDGGAVVPAGDGPVLVLGRFDGAPPAEATAIETSSANGRVDAASEAGAEHTVAIRDVGDKKSEGWVELAREARAEAGARALDAWKPWFPVIDYDRCTNCMQCLTFCLFDVYGVDEDKQIQVQNNSNCKTDCPACSRVCPEVAILFPKYKKGPINGDVVRAEDVQKESMKVDITALLGGDLYGSLRKRSTEARQRFSTERDESRALLERKRCLTKLRKDVDIPDEVLMTLPSAGDIEERAERAKVKLAKRRAESQSVRDERRSATEDEWGI